MALILSTHGKKLAKVAHFQRSDIGLEHKLRDIGAGSISFLELFVDVFKLRRTEIVFLHLFVVRQVSTSEDNQPTVVYALV